MEACQNRFPEAPSALCPFAILAGRQEWFACMHVKGKPCKDADIASLRGLHAKMQSKSFVQAVMGGRGNAHHPEANLPQP
jgi:hypothetical protein